MQESILTQLREDVAQIKVALIGDSMGKPGALHRLSAVELEIVEMKKVLAKEITDLRGLVTKLDIRVTLIAIGVSTATALIQHMIVTKL